jgi:flagellar biosynthetic protein FliR
VIVWPAVYPSVAALPGLEGASGITLARYMGAEAMIGTIIGMGARFIIMSLQLAGSIAAQSTSISQIFGAGVTPDPMPAIGNVLVVSALALAFSQGLHIKVAITLMRSYEVAAPGVFPDPTALTQWGVERVAGAFALAFGLAAPFVAAAFAYNVALGAINRAMPSLMVAFVGAPAITAGAMLLLIFAGPPMLIFWTGKLDTALSDPLGPSP